MTRRGGHSRRTVRKTREAIIATFSALVLNGRYAELGVREIARKAGVGRSTFYEHFDHKMALLIDSMYPLLSVLADAVGGSAASQLPWVLGHFEQQRDNALALFHAPSERGAIEAGFARLVAQHFPSAHATLSRNEVASTLSRLTIGLIADWLAADRRVTPDKLATTLVKTAEAVRSALLP